MINPSEPLYRSYAKTMLGVREIPESLEEKLRVAEELVHAVKPHGCLSSTQTIATIIMIWELEQTLKKYESL